MKRHLFILLLALLALNSTSGQLFLRLELPNRDQLPTERVLTVMQDSEGCLWYATEGGGICRDDGRQMTVMRNDATHPELLGSNNVDCLAEAGRLIVVGTFHGAYVLDKRDFSIRRLQQVDDNRVDDIIVTRKGEVLLTANKKIYHYDKSLRLLHTYPSHWKGKEAYVHHLFEDRQGRLWATQWNGGLLRLQGDDFVEQPWNMDCQPTDMADADNGRLWIGTVGRGIVAYHPDKGTTEQQPQTDGNVCVDLQPSADGQRLWMITMNTLAAYQTGHTLNAIGTDDITESKEMTLHRMTLDLDGRLLVAGSRPGPFVVTLSPQRPWHTGNALSTAEADSVRTVLQLSARPTATATDKNGNLWFSTGKDIRRMRQGKEETVLGDVKDVSAMAFTHDGTLWLATIFGKVMSYHNGKLNNDDYASNEHGDAVTMLTTDSLGRLLMVNDRYTRCYDPQRHTMRQQSRETAGTYCIELQETAPGKRWCLPPGDNVVERLPQWLTSWWMWCVYALAILLVVLLIVHDYQLRRQRKRFMEQIKLLQTTHDEPEKQPETDSENADNFIKKAIAQVETHLSDGDYSVEQLSADLCMSRMTFYRKIQSATGQKPTEFMRTVRLRHAAELLREGRQSITQISYATGFSSVSYFSRCFRTMYGVPPTQFADRPHDEAPSMITADNRLPNEKPN